MLYELAYCFDLAGADEASITFFRLFTDEHPYSSVSWYNLGNAFAKLERVTAAAFGQRRKMLRQSLKSVPGALEALEKVGIDPAWRAETVSVAEFIALTHCI